MDSRRLVPASVLGSLLGIPSDIGSLERNYVLPDENLTLIATRRHLACQRTGSAARSAHRPRRKHESFAFGPSGVEFPSQSRAGQRSTLGPRSHLSAGRAPIAQQLNSYGARS